jgi:hypothetical protein
MEELRECRKNNRQVQFELEIKVNGPGLTLDEARFLTRRINSIKEAVKALDWEIWSRTRSYHK